MTNKAQNILIFIVMTFLIALVVLWFYIFNEGVLIVQTGVGDYTIYANTFGTACVQDPCEIELKIGKYQVQFQKEGYITSSSQTEIIRGKTSVVKFEAKKKMEIKESTSAPPENKVEPVMPSELSEDGIIAYSWNKNGDRFIFLDKNDNRLKIRESNGEIKLITSLKNILSIVFYWSPDEKYILGHEENGLYFIEIDMGSRKKYNLEFSPINITWSSTNDFLLINDDAYSLYKINWDEMDNIQKLDITLNLDKSVWIDDATLLTYEIDTDRNLTEIVTYSPTTLTKENVAQKFDFPVDQIGFDPVQNIIYFHHERDNNWYEMKM